MSYYQSSLCIFLFVLFIDINPLFALTKDTITGAKPMSMGGAFTAVANDYNATVWNPAALDLQLTQPQFGISYTRHFEDINQYFFSVAYPTRYKGGFGVHLNILDYGKLMGYDSIGVQTENFTHRDISGGISYGKKIWDKIYGGATMKYANVNLSHIASASGISFDVSLIAPVNKVITLGMIMKNIGDWKLKDDSGMTQTFESASSRLGVAVNATEELTVAGDIESIKGKFADNYSAGVNFRIMGVDLRFGTQVYKKSMILSAGIGYGRAGSFTIDYAFLNQNDLGENHRFSVGIPFGDDVKAIEVDGRKVREAELEKLKEIGAKILRIYNIIDYPKQKPVLAVLKPKVIGEIGEAEHENIWTELVSAIGRKGVFNLIERQDLDRVLEEVKIHYTGMVDQSDSRYLAEIGKQWGTKIVILSEVEKVGEKYRFSARMVNIETAEIIIPPEKRFEFEYNSKDIRETMESIAWTFTSPLITINTHTRR